MPAFKGYREYYRLVATLGVTEEGLFKEDQIPDDVVSSVLYVETVYRVVLTDAAGQLTYMDFDNPAAMDSERDTGGPVILDGETLYTESGPSTVPLTLVKKFSQRLPEGWKARADQMNTIAENQGVLGNGNT